MANHFGTALLATRKTLGLMQKEVANAAGISGPSLSDIELLKGSATPETAAALIRSMPESNRATLGIAYVNDIIERLGVSGLVTVIEVDHDEVFPADPDVRTLQEAMTIPEVENLVRFHARLLRENKARSAASMSPVDRRYPEPTATIPLCGTVYADGGEHRGKPITIPLCGEIAAGEPMPMLDHCEELEVSLEIAKAAGDLGFATRVSGRSMEPGIKDGAVVVLRQAEEPTPGEVHAFIVDGGATLKRYVNGNLVSDNPDYSDIVPQDEAQLVGRVVGVI